MIEYHGWAIIRESYSEEDESLEKDEENRVKLENKINLIRERIKEIENVNAVYFLRSFNFGFWHLTIEADHNHRDERIIDFFKWVAEFTVGSYGLLYVHDDEDIARGNDNKFMVWRMTKGQVAEFDDLFLSPYFPTVEDPS